MQDFPGPGLYAGLNLGSASRPHTLLVLVGGVGFFSCFFRFLQFSLSDCSRSVVLSLLASLLLLSRLSMDLTQDSKVISGTCF